MIRWWRTHRRGKHAAVQDALTRRLAAREAARRCDCDPRPTAGHRLTLHLRNGGVCNLTVDPDDAHAIRMRWQERRSALLLGGRAELPGVDWTIRVSALSGARWEADAADIIALEIA